MYLLKLQVENSKMLGRFLFECVRDNHSIRKWSVMAPGLMGKDLLRMAAVALTDIRFIEQIPYSVTNMARRDDLLRLQYLLACHSRADEHNVKHPLITGGVQIASNGECRRLKAKECRDFHAYAQFKNILTISSLARYFLLAYDCNLSCHADTDDFDFNDPFKRINRIHSLFNPNSPVTDPIAFLGNLHHRFRYRRHLPVRLLQTICPLLSRYLDIDTSRWMDHRPDYHRELSLLKPWQQITLLPVLDACRNLLDAFPRCNNALEMPGVILMHRPDRLCPPASFRNWIGLLNEMFPKMQFVITVGKKAVMPENVSAVLLPLPKTKTKNQKHPNASPRRLPPKTVLLIDIDSRFPNLALMKLSRYYKDQGYNVVLELKDAQLSNVNRVFASCVFYSKSSRRYVKRLERFYGDALTVGGSGADILMRLPDEIENLPADYSLYPKWDDRAIGFLTRGCPNKCRFCIVPRKEGKPRQVCDLDTLLEGRKKLILLDDNILAHPNAGDLLEEMASRDLRVNFNQTLDIRLVDREKSRMLKRISCANARFTRCNYHFSLNDNRKFDNIADKYRLFEFTRSDNVEFICMYGYNTTLEEDVQRFRFLRSLTGAYVFVQAYQPIPGGPPPDLDDFFGENADELIDELIRILFPQNMKSMEKYYRWISKRYAQTFGKLHMGLVDTIFRYNHRHRKGSYIATLAGTKKWI